jgi:hypothetical protein
MLTLKTIVTTLCAACACAAASAQSSYTANLRKSEPGKGTVVIVQSDEIERIVNTSQSRGAAAGAKAKTAKGNAATARKDNGGKKDPKDTKQQKSATPSTDTHDKDGVAKKEVDTAKGHTPATPAAPSREQGHNILPEVSKSVHVDKYEGGYYVARQRHKAQGYRICIYTGGNSRKDREAAVKMGNTCRSYFSELAAYTSFESPRWVTHVGDFRTKEEAQKYVKLIRRKRFTYETRVVRSTVNLPD